MDDTRSQTSEIPLFAFLLYRSRTRVPRMMDYPPCLCFYLLLVCLVSVFIGGVGCLFRRLSQTSSPQWKDSSGRWVGRLQTMDQKRSRRFYSRRPRPTHTDGFPVPVPVSFIHAGPPWVLSLLTRTHTGNYMLSVSRLLDPNSTVETVDDGLKPGRRRRRRHLPLFF